MSSIDTILILQKRGYLSKGASDRIAEQRSDLIRESIAQATSSWFSKEATLQAGNPLRRFGSALGKARTKGSGHAGWPEWLADIGKVMGVGAGLAAGNAAVGAAGHAIGNLGLKKKIKGSKSEVLGMLGEKNPEIQNQQSEVFDLVARYAPTLAADPLIAAGIVQGIAKGTGGMSRNLPHVDANFAKSLAEAESRVNESRINTRFGKMHEKAIGVTNQYSFGDEK